MRLIKNVRANMIYSVSRNRVIVRISFVYACRLGYLLGLFELLGLLG